MRVPVMSVGIVWVHLDRPIKFRCGRGPIPVIVQFDKCQRGACLSECVVQFQSFQRRRLCFWNSVPGGDGTCVKRKGERCITVSQTGVCQRVIRLFLYRLIEILDSLFLSRLGSLVPKETAFEIKLISFSVLCRTLRQ